MTQSPKGNYSTAAEHQSHLMAKNPRPNRTMAKPSAPGTQSLSGMASSAKSKADSANSGSGDLRAPSGSAKPAADPVRRKSGA